MFTFHSQGYNGCYTDMILIYIKWAHGGVKWCSICPNLLLKTPTNIMWYDNNNSPSHYVGFHFQQLHRAQKVLIPPRPMGVTGLITRMLTRPKKSWCRGNTEQCWSISHLNGSHCSCSFKRGQIELTHPGLESSIAAANTPQIYSQQITL